MSGTVLALTISLDPHGKDAIIVSGEERNSDDESHYLLATDTKRVICPKLQG
jgi:hypothetical protein